MQFLWIYFYKFSFIIFFIIFGTQIGNTVLRSMDGLLIMTITVGLNCLLNTVNAWKLKAQVALKMSNG